MSIFKRYSIAVLSLLTTMTASLCVVPTMTRPETVASAATAPATPTQTIDDTSYNMLVIYEWTVGAGGDQLAISQNNLDFIPCGKAFLRQYSFPEYVGTDICAPDYQYAKSYNSSTRLYSPGKVQTEHTVTDSNGTQHVLYGYPAQYTMVGQFAYWSTSGDVPQKYDQNKYVWYHNANDGDTIKATFIYDGVFADIEVKIPWLGTKTSEVTIKGVKFQLRTGPNKCSFRVNQSGVNSALVEFAFGIEKD